MNDDSVILSTKYITSEKMTYHNKRQISAKFAKEELLKDACNACKQHAKGHCNGNRHDYFSKYSRDCFYEYLANLPKEKQDEYYQLVLKSDERASAPCCEFCRYHFPACYEDIPESHISGWWIGGCSHPEAKRETSSEFVTSPDWCPIREIENFTPEDWMDCKEFVIIKGDPFDGRF